MSHPLRDEQTRDDKGSVHQEEERMDREQLVQLNKDIALHAKRKELDEAMALFKQALEAKAENSHTYSNAINANIRCGNLSGAEKVMEIMKKRGRKKDVIICTTMIKGYCSVGRVHHAVSFFNEMIEKAPIVTPNLRTINTLLRGCVQTGDVVIAEALVAKAQKDLKIALDVSSWEYLTALLAQSLKLDKVLPIVGRLKDDASCASGMAGMHVSTARAAAVLGDWKVCRKSITNALAALDKAATCEAPAEDDEAAPAAPKSDKNTGGKRAWNSEEVDARRVESLEVYREHLKSELSAELKIIEAFMESAKTSKTTPFEYIFPYFLRVFPLAMAGDAAPAGKSGAEDGGRKKDSGLKKEVVKAVMRAVEENFGLDVFARRLTKRSCDDISGYTLETERPVIKLIEPPKYTSKGKVKKGQENAKSAAGAEESAAVAAPVPEVVPAVPAVEKAPLTPLEAQIASFRAQSARAFDSSCKFVFKNVFQNSAVGATGEGVKAAAVADRPLKVEVCSGAGEWVVAQAKQDPGADWLALELRHDRAYQTLTKAVFASVPNLAVLCGDAMHILPTHFPANAVTNLFVNHPEPPQQTGGKGESQNKHLLDQAFFVEANRILKPNGTLTIVTDNLWYGRLLMRLVANLPFSAYTDAEGGAVDLKNAQCLQSASAPTSYAEEASRAQGCLESEWAEQEREGAVVLYVGKPGAAAGHVVEASSYFDRLWKRGNLVERYFLVLRKVPASQAMSAAAVAQSSVGKKRPSGSIEMKVVAPKGMENVKNSRIKFD